jgi:hypothetical protein
MLSYVLGLMSIVAGGGAIGWFLFNASRNALQQGDLLLLAVALFLFAIALGVWHIDGTIQDHLDNLKK